MFLQPYNSGSIPRCLRATVQYTVAEAEPQTHQQPKMALAASPASMVPSVILPGPMDLEWATTRDAQTTRRGDHRFPRGKRSPDRQVTAVGPSLLSEITGLPRLTLLRSRSRLRTATEAENVCDETAPGDGDECGDDKGVENVSGEEYADVDEEIAEEEAEDCQDGDDEFGDPHNWKEKVGKF
ncbi:hypothetical protein MTO96_034164 [Rhipicephalus appendiculatus]